MVSIFTSLVFILELSGLCILSVSGKLLVARCLLFVQLPYLFGTIIEICKDGGICMGNPLDFLHSIGVFVLVHNMLILLGICYLFLFLYREIMMREDEEDTVWEWLFRGGEKESEED